MLLNMCEASHILLAVSIWFLSKTFTDTIFTWYTRAGYCTIFNCTKYSPHSEKKQVREDYNKIRLVK